MNTNQTTGRKRSRRARRTPEPRLGIDIGRVIISTGDGRGDTSFLGSTEDSALTTPPMADALAAIRQLTERFEGRVWLVSKCGPRIQARSRRWLDRWRFFAETGVRSDHVRFCRQRPQKADHCAQLRITHFVDDRTDVLRHLHEQVPHLYLFGPQKRPAPEWVVWTRTWEEARRAINRSLDA